MRWLRPGEVPTIGNWFRAAGYDTHYDGKWHVSHADLMKNGKPVPTNSGDGHVFPEAVQAYLDADPLGEFGFSGWVGPDPTAPISPIRATSATRCTPTAPSHGSRTVTPAAQPAMRRH